MTVPVGIAGVSGTFSFRAGGVLSFSAATAAGALAGRSGAGFGGAGVDGAGCAIALCRIGDGLFFAEGGEGFATFAAALAGGG